MERVPIEVFQFLGVNRETAHQMGMLGCGLQLNETGDYDWSELTITLSPDKEEVLLFLTVEGIPFTAIPGHVSRYIRIGILQFEEYIKYYLSIREFLMRFRKYRYLRLGRRAHLPAWQLTCQEVALIRLSDEDFDRNYISDPRRSLTFSESLRGGYLHTPVLRPGCEGVRNLPGPRTGGWIRSSSPARRWSLST